MKEIIIAELIVYNFKKLKQKQLKRLHLWVHKDLPRYMRLFKKVNVGKKVKATLK